MLAALHPRRVGRLILFAPANPYWRSCDFVAQLCSTPWGGFLAWMLPYFPASIQRITLGEIYGGPDRVIDSCLQEIVDGLRSPGTLRHVLCTIRCWLAERATLKSALRRVKRIPTLLVWGDCDGTISLSSAVKLNRRLHGSELIVLPGGGHSVFEEMPEKTNRIVPEWLGRNSPSTPLDLPRAASVARKNRAAAAIWSLSPGN